MRARKKTAVTSPIERMGDWTGLPGLAWYKILKNMDEKTRCSICLVCKDWCSAEKDQPPRWVSFKVQLPKPIQHVSCFTRVKEAGHLEKLELVFPYSPRKDTSLGSFYLAAASGSNIQEVNLISLPSSDLVPLLDLLPKLLKVHIVVDWFRIDVDRFRIDGDGDSIVRKLSKLIRLSKFTDLSLNFLEGSKPSTYRGSGFLQEDVSPLLKSASCLTSLELLAQCRSWHGSGIFCTLKNLRSLSITTEWIEGSLSQENFRDWSRLTKLELWAMSNVNLKGLVDIPILKELKLQVKDCATLRWRGQAQNLQLTSLDLKLIEKPAIQDPAQSQMYIPASLAKAFPSLTKLCISNMGFSNLSQNILSFLPDLTHLSLTNNELISLPANLNQLTHLEELSVRRNPIIFDDEELATIKSMPNLKTIFVQTPRRSKNAYQESWTRIHSTHIKKLRAIEPRLCVKEIVSPESENQDTSDASDSDDEE